MRHAGEHTQLTQDPASRARGEKSGGRRRVPAVVLALALVLPAQAVGTAAATASPAATVAPVAAAAAPAAANGAVTTPDARTTPPAAGGTVGGSTKKPAGTTSKKKVAKLPAGPVARAIPGRTTASLTWRAKKGATRYLVELTSVTPKGASKPASTAKPVTRKVTTRKTTIRITGLRQQTAYKVRVTADRGVRTRPSRTITVRTSSAAATRVTARIKPAGTDAVRISWTRPTRATSVSVTIAPTAAELGNRSVHLTINGLSAWTTSTVVKIPKRLRTRIGSTSGNPVHARVTAYNSEHTWTHSASVAAYAGSPTVHGTTADRTRVATYNVQLPSITQDIPGRSWADRREAVARAIAKGKPDVVGLQEVGMSVVAPGVRQYQDLAQLLAPYGYAWATTTEQVDAIRATPVQRSFGAHIAYRTSTTELLGSGFVNLKDAAAAQDPTTAWVDADGVPDIDRYATWALLRDRDSGRELYAASVHLKVGTTKADQKLRDASARGLDRFLRRLARTQGRPSAPIIVLGDLNSDNAREPEGAQERFVAAGYVSSVSAPKRTSMSNATVNSQSGGYPARPAVWSSGGPRIDHILVRGGGGVVKHVNQVVLTPRGTFDERYRGSDHNLQLAVVSLAPR